MLSDLGVEPFVALERVTVEVGKHSFIFFCTTMRQGHPAHSLSQSAHALSLLQMKAMVVNQDLLPLGVTWPRYSRHLSG